MTMDQVFTIGRMARFTLLRRRHNWRGCLATKFWGVLHLLAQICAIEFLRSYRGYLVSQHQGHSQNGKPEYHGE